MSILILPKDNEVNTILPVQGNPSPFTLTTSWQDMPANHVIKTNGRESLGLWLDVSNTTKIYFRVLCTFHGSSDFFQLPNQFVSLDNGVRVVPQEYYVDAATATDKFVITFSLADTIHYVKIQVKGTGQINNAYATVKGNFK